MLDLENPKLLEFVPQLNISVTDTTTNTTAIALLTADSSSLLNKECEVTLLTPNSSACRIN